MANNWVNYFIRCSALLCQTVRFSQNKLRKRKHLSNVSNSVCQSVRKNFLVTVSVAWYLNNATPSIMPVLRRETANWINLAGVALRWQDSDRLSDNYAINARRSNFLPCLPRAKCSEIACKRKQRSFRSALWTMFVVPKAISIQKFEGWVRFGRGLSPRSGSVVAGT